MYLKKTMMRVSLILAFISFFAIGQNAWAATITWTGTTSSNWGTASNWDIGVPTATDDVVIPYVVTNMPTLDQNRTVASLAITAGAVATQHTILTLNGYTLNVTGNTTVTGQAAVASDSRILGNVSNSALIVGGHLNLTATAGNGGALLNLNATNTQLVILGNLTVANAAEAILNISQCDVTVSGTWTRGAAGVVTTDADTDLTLDGTVAVTLNIAATSSDLNSLTIDKDGADVTIESDLEIASDFELTDNNVEIAAGVEVILNGNLTLAGTSSFTAADETAEVAFGGGVAQVITVNEGSILEFGILNVTAASTVTTASSFTVRNYITTAVGTSFTASAGYATFNPLIASDLWNNGGTLSLHNVSINTNSFAAAPATPATITGDFTKIGTNPFLPTANTITFANTNPGGKNLQMIGNVADGFFNLAVASGSTVKTSSSFQIAGNAAGAINIIGTGSFIAQAGTITFTGANGTILNSASGTLKFNNLANTAATTTTASFTIGGTFTTGAAFTASNGTITFENNVEKDLTFTTAPTFFRIKVANGSKVKTVGPHNFTITGAGSITLESGAVFTQAAGGTATFAAAGTKTITVASDASLTFGIVSIADVVNNSVTTSSNFTIAGNALTLLGAAGTFVATSPSNITFTTAATLTSATTARITLHNMTISNVAVTLVAASFMNITGNLTINGASGRFIAGSNASSVTFNGTTQQKITGTSTNPVPVDFGTLEIAKAHTGTDATSDDVLMELNVRFLTGAGSVLTLTDGELNLGAKTLTLDGVTVTRNTGAIHGNQGTLLLSTTANTFTAPLNNTLFTPEFPANSVPTLWNLTVGIAQATGGNLTINNDLAIGAVFTITTANTVSLYGDLTLTAGNILALNAGTSVLKFAGTGKANHLQTNTFGATLPSLTFERGETLTGNLTLIAANVLTINTSVNVLDIGANTLTLNDGTILNLVSGSIKADAVGSGVVFGTHASQTTIPANLFTNNVVNNITISIADVTLGGDLTINGTLTNATPSSIITNNNTLTFGASSVGFATFTAAKPVIGNLRRTVTNAATVFPIGGGAAASYRPITLQFANAGSSQAVKVSSALTNPTLGRGGDPTRAINALWTVTPEGTAPSDSLKMTFGWGTSHDNDLAADFASNKTFITKWGGTSWVDYRNAAVVYNAAAPKTLTPSASPISASDLAGEWTIFDAAFNTPGSKDSAISTSYYKLAITNVDPNPVQVGFPFSVTVQLQDKDGNPYLVPSDGPITLTFEHMLGGSSANFPVGAVIPVGSSTAIIPGFSYTTTAAANNQFRVSGTGAASLVTVLGGVSPLINVYETPTGNQAYNITIAETSTTATITFLTTGGNALILLKAGSAITSDEFPSNGTTYITSTNFGQGAKIGDAVAVYIGGTGSSFTVTGLAPGTYYVRGFGIAGTPGTEFYNIFPASGNPKSFTITSNVDDDVVFGPNNTRATAKPIGTNLPIQGTIKDINDEDWFSFTINNNSPNMRSMLVLDGISGNYNIDLYDVNGRRLRRGSKVGNATEAQLVNNLIPGTYTVRIYGKDGSYSKTNPYTLRILTKDEEIFSVTK